MRRPKIEIKQSSKNNLWYVSIKEGYGENQASIHGYRSALEAKKAAWWMRLSWLFAKVIVIK